MISHSLPGVTENGLYAADDWGDSPLTLEPASPSPGPVQPPSRVGSVASPTLASRPGRRPDDRTRGEGQIVSNRLKQQIDRENSYDAEEIIEILMLEPMSPVSCDDLIGPSLENPQCGMKDQYKGAYIPKDICPQLDQEKNEKLTLEAAPEIISYKQIPDGGKTLTILKSSEGRDINSSSFPPTPIIPDFIDRILRTCFFSTKNEYKSS